MTARREVLGWCAGKSRRRHGDETGVMHLLTAEPGYGLVVNPRAVCGSRGMLSGQVERTLPATARACRGCLAWERRNTR
jgi:hypothetical protein